MSLVPKSGVHISEAHYPKGFYVALYDANGFASSPRWFPTRDAAETYARNLGAH